MPSLPHAGGIELWLQSHNVGHEAYVFEIKGLTIIDSCRCGNEFCYVCGLRWKTCRCELWDEHQLVNRANQVFERQPQPVVRGPEYRQQRLQGIIQELRGRHECGHEGRWKRIDGPHRCEQCRYMLPNFILECRYCNIRACVRCRMNRL